MNTFLFHIRKRLSQSSNVKLPFKQLVLERNSAQSLHTLFDLFIDHCLKTVALYPDETIREVAEYYLNGDSINQNFFTLIPYLKDFKLNIKTIPVSFFDFVLYQANVQPQNQSGISMTTALCFAKIDQSQIETIKLALTKLVINSIPNFSEAESSLFLLLGRTCSSSEKVSAECEKYWSGIPREAIDTCPKTTNLLFSIYAGDIKPKNTKNPERFRLISKLSRQQALIKHFMCLNKITTYSARATQVIVYALNSNNFMMQNLGAQFARKVVRTGISHRDTDLKQLSNDLTVQVVCPVLLSKIPEHPGEIRDEALIAEIFLVLTDLLDLNAMLVSKLLLASKLKSYLEILSTQHINRDIYASCRLFLTKICSQSHGSAVKTLFALYQGMVFDSNSNKDIEMIFADLAVMQKNIHSDSASWSPQFIYRLSRFSSSNDSALATATTKIIDTWFNSQMVTSDLISEMLDLVESEFFTSSYILELIYENSKSENKSRLMKCIVKVFLESKESISSKLIDIATEKIDSDTWKSLGNQSRVALLDLMNSSSVASATKLARIFVETGFQVDSYSITPTTKLLLCCAESTYGGGEILSIINKLTNYDPKTDEKALEMAFQMLLMKKSSIALEFKDSHVESICEHLFSTFEKTQSTERKKSMLSSLIKVASLKDDVKILEKIYEKMIAEKDLLFLEFFAKILYENLSNHTHHNFLVTVYKFFKAEGLGKSKIRELQLALLFSELPAVTLLEFCDEVDILQVYTKFLHQDEILQQATVKVLKSIYETTKSENFLEKLFSSIRVMSLPKVSSEANTVLFYRDLIEICNDTSTSDKFLDIITASQDKKSASLVLPESLLTKILLMTFDASTTISSRARKIMKVASNQEQSYSILKSPLFYSSALDKILSADQRQRYMSTEAIYASLDRIITTASIENFSPILSLDMKLLVKVWSAVLKLTDDVQEKPRLSAIRLTEESSPLIKLTSLLSLEAVTKKYKEKISPKTVSKMLSDIIDTFVATITLTKSTKSRTIATQCLNLILNKNTKEALRPYALKLVPLLIESASALESPKLQALTMSASVFGSTELQVKINELKLEIFIKSELNDILQTCVNLCDNEEMMTSLTKTLISTIKTGLGTTTKCVALMLVQDTIKPIEKLNSQNSPYYNGKFMAALFSVLDDPSVTLYSRTAKSIVALLKSSATKASTVKNVVERIIQYFFEEKYHPQLATLCSYLPDNVFSPDLLSLCFLAGSGSIKGVPNSEVIEKVFKLVYIFLVYFLPNIPHMLLLVP